MTRDDAKRAKVKILKCLTEDFEYGQSGEKHNQAIFDHNESWQVFNGTDLEMVMDKVVLGLYFAMDDLRSADEK